MALNVFLKNVVIKDYKSIQACNVDLSEITFLVGPNGSGKSNFLDAIRFVSDSLKHSVEQAIRDRGGVDNVRRRSAGHPNHFAMKITLEAQSQYVFDYHFKIGAQSGGGFIIHTEECRWQDLGRNRSGFFLVRKGAVVSSSLNHPPPTVPDRLYLNNAAGLPEFNILFQALVSMGFYNLNPDRIKDLQTPDAGELLTRDGSNLASVLNNLGRKDLEGKTRLLEYLERIVPGLSRVEHEVLGPRETIRFYQASESSKTPRKFMAASMSDGSLRALGVLTALFQAANGVRYRSLVAIEEPEMALHPAAAGVLLDALREASESRQILVTSHSPELLDRKDIDPDSILAVMEHHGESKIGKLTAGKKTLLRQKMSTAGELLRLNQLRPDLKAIPSASQLKLFF